MTPSEMLRMNEELDALEKQEDFDKAVTQQVAAEIALRLLLRRNQQEQHHEAGND